MSDAMKQKAGQVMQKYFQLGNVDLLNRPMVPASRLIAAGWTDAGTGTATVFSVSYKAGSQGISRSENVIIHITPIRSDGTVLPPEILDSYVSSILSAPTINDIIKTDKNRNSILLWAQGPVTDWNSADSKGELFDDLLHRLQAVYYLGEDDEYPTDAELKEFTSASKTTGSTTVNKSLKVEIPGLAEFWFDSHWKCKQNEKGVWVISKRPTEGSFSATFQYSLASGVKITGAKVHFRIGSPLSGYSYLKVNGSSDRTPDGAGGFFYPVSLSASSGSYTVNFTYRANGKVFQDTDDHWGSIGILNLYLQIDYQESKPVQAKEKPVAEGIFEVPPQSVCIYDREDGSIYTFDGVTKVQHSLTMDIQEEPDKNKDKYVNNARNEPDKLTIDVLMSDVYTGGGDIINNSGSYNSGQRSAFDAAKGAMIQGNQDTWTRSESAYHTLHRIKENRRKLAIITPQFVYTEMILSTVTVNHEDTTPFGWEGQLVFQHAFEPKEEKKENNSKKKTNNDNISVPSASNSVSVGDWLNNMMGFK